MIPSGVFPTNSSSRFDQILFSVPAYCPRRRSNTHIQLSSAPRASRQTSYGVRYWKYLRGRWFNNFSIRLISLCLSSWKLATLGKDRRVDPLTCSALLISRLWYGVQKKDWEPKASLMASCKVFSLPLS